MPNNRFFNTEKPLRLDELASRVGARLSNDGSAGKEINGVASLESAGDTDLSFFENRRYLEKLSKTNAGAILVEEKFLSQVPAGTVALITKQPYRAFALAAQSMYPNPSRQNGVAASASVDPTATIDPTAQIEEGAAVRAGAVIGRDCRVGANAVIDWNVVVGDGTQVGAGAYLGYCEVGQRCLIHPGVRIGTRGFGFAMDEAGHIDVPQLGGVRIGNQVEIGANSTVDRGMSEDTTIGDGTKIDNLVQIGHNVQIGKGCVIVSLTGVAGSTILEDYVVLAAQVGVAGHLRVGKGAQIAGKGGVIRDVPAGARLGGVPAIPIKQWFRQHALLERLTRQNSKTTS